MTNPILSKLGQRSFPEVADALHTCRENILRQWEAAVRERLPDHPSRLGYQGARDDVPAILDALADALRSPHPDRTAGVADTAPAHGRTRCHQGADPAQLMQGDRLLRATIFTELERTLARRTTLEEALALHTAVDVALQEAIAALVTEQQSQLRTANERERKFLAYLSHDLNNNLHAVTLTLQLLRDRLAASPGFADAVESIADAEQAIESTTAGMRELLRHEHLRSTGGETPTTPATAGRHPTDLHALVTRVAHPFAPDAHAKGVRLHVKVPPDATADTDPELLTLVLQNLLANAIKFTRPGTTVRVRTERRTGHTPAAGGRLAPASPHWDLSVCDHSPGIPPEDRDRIFGAFQRGQTFGQAGVGLGLSIASEAARLLDASLTVESTVGAGTTFRLSLPPSPRTR